MILVLHHWNDILNDPKPFRRKQMWPYTSLLLYIQNINDYILYELIIRVKVKSVSLTAY
jgi:hypothetical protein